MSEATFRFCPVCGSPFEPRVLRVGEPARLVCTSGACGFVFYLDPKVAVGTIVTRPDGHIVLVKRAIEPGYGKWVFPGGYVGRGEEVTLAAIREAREEAGLDIRIDRLIGHIRRVDGRCHQIGPLGLQRTRAAWRDARVALARK